MSTKAALGRAVSTSLPTAMDVILVAGTKAATFLLTQSAAAERDWPTRRSWSLGTEIMTSMPLWARAVSIWWSASKRRTCVIFLACKIETMAEAGGMFDTSVPTFIPTKAPLI